MIGSLDGPDRLLVNDGTGRLALEEDVFDADPSRGTLGMALADLDGDGRLDVVEAQGEVEGYEDERVYFGTDVLARTPLPRSSAPRSRGGRWSPASTTTARRTWLRTGRPSLSGGRAAQHPMTWYGENLFYSALPRGVRRVEVCAIDIAGNETCAQPG